MISACSVWPEEKDQEGRPLAPVAPLLYGKCPMHNRVQWFWHFFRNPICFMCFWFGLEILRLVYKKRVFWNIEWFLSYLTFYPPKKVILSLMRAEKKILQNWAYRVSKEAEFCADFKTVQKSRVWQKEKKFFQKKWIFKDLENLAKNHFSEKKSLGTSWRKSSSHFWNQRKIPLLLIPFAPNSKKFFSNSYKGWCCFFKVKSSNKIETAQ